MIQELDWSYRGENTIGVESLSPNNIVIIDDQNRVVFFNAAAEAFWGCSRIEVLSQNVHALVPHILRAHHDGYISANRETGINKIVGVSWDVRMVRRTGGALRLDVDLEDRSS